MSDRELLEMAAKAAGYKFHMDDFEGYPIFIIDGLPIPWNPLICDGDALRLATKLDIHIKRFAGVTIAEEWTTLNKAEEHDSWPWNNGNQLVSTRRAIVRAAAEIGKTMP